VAYSGGRDSSALLHATLAVALEQGLEVVALHVHHGLSERADDWLAHCERQCKRWVARGAPLRFAHRRLTGSPARGDSIEAWARRERYAALRQMAIAHAAGVVLLAHHRQDQAETLLLQALRGSGVAGLAAMPQAIERDGITWLRPWLKTSAASVAAYAKQHRLRHIVDDTNADPRFARNRLRLWVWPILLDAFPQAEAALAASATWAREAQSCADALAEIDLAGCADARGIDIALWSQLSPNRRSNALRAWLKAQMGRPATAASVERLLVELPASRAPARWNLDAFALRRYRGRLVCSNTSDCPPAMKSTRATTLSVTRAGVYELPDWGGALHVRRVSQGGIAMSSLTHLRLVERCSGEQFQLAGNRPPRSLKKQYQALGIPDWERGGPLLYGGEQLLFVPGLGIDARVRAGKGVIQASIDWTPSVD
jgi:tRNA(Ile)-lysidine synthase